MMPVVAVRDDLDNVLGMFQSDSGKWLCDMLEDKITFPTSRK